MMNLFKIEFSQFRCDGRLTTRCCKKGSHDRSHHVDNHEAFPSSTVSPLNTAAITGLTEGGHVASVFGIIQGNNMAGLRKSIGLSLFAVAAP
jgi:hypothetical protein